MSNFQILKKIFWDFIENTWKMKFIFMILLWIWISFLSYLEPIFFTQIIKVIEDYLKNWFFKSNDFFRYFIYWWIFIFISIISSLIYVYYLVRKNTLLNYIKVSSKYSKKIINMSYPDYLSKEVWAVYKIFDRWVGYQFEFIHFFFLELIKTWWWIIFISIILFYNDYKMTFITLSLLPVMILFWFLFFKKLWPYQKKIDKKWDSIFADIWNIMSVFSLVKILSIEKIFSKKIDEKLDFCYNEQLKLYKWWTISDLYTGFFITISRFLVLWFWVYFLINWKITFSTLFLFFSYIWWIYFPIWNLFWMLWSVQSRLTAIWKFYSEFDSLDLEYKSEKWIKLKKISWEIEFDNVNFSYWDNNVINNLSFKLIPWEKVAFVWDTWAWKSTIINLILRFWNLKNWEIRIDWNNINMVNLKSLRNHIWVVSQDNSLFNLSIEENLLFANPKATNKEIELALKHTEAEFVFKLPEWLKTIIWERWLKLSWWEKQRISIARLFLKNPKILILDEATSALDNKTEKLIQRALDELMKWKTSIVIAHRLTTIKHIDRIFMLEKWKIVEQWNYEELINLGWKFFHLVNPKLLIIN